jgi:hypothetical protein
MVAIFVSNGRLSCLPHLDTIASIFSIATFCLSEVCFFQLNMTMLSCLICQSFIYLTVEIKKTLEDFRTDATGLHFRYKQ